ncbi:MAG: hypothetical protein H6738_21360 [Alphaproteobacteria bacterium]|nr:hypothetical protein [Alphaproteobacteria bacterium]
MSGFEGERPRPSAAAVFLQLGLGVFLTFALHVVIGGPLWMVGSVFSPVESLAGAWLMGLSVAQLLYVVPVAIAMAFVRRPIALGMLIGAAITFLLQSACYGLAFFLLKDLH